MVSKKYLAAAQGFSYPPFMQPSPGQIYFHYKGSAYICVANATLEATGEAVVVYKEAKAPFKCFVRPLSEWNEFVHNGATKVPRFQRATEIRIKD